MTPDFSKDTNGLLPAIVQDAQTGKVLMLGYMNEESLAKTKELKKVTFFSRSKNRYGQKVRRAAISWKCWILSWIVIMTHF